MKYELIWPRGYHCLTSIVLNTHHGRQIVILTKGRIEQKEDPVRIITPAVWSQTGICVQ